MGNLSNSTRVGYWRKKTKKKLHKKITPKDEKIKKITPNKLLFGQISILDTGQVCMFK